MRVNSTYNRPRDATNTCRPRRSLMEKIQDLDKDVPLYGSRCANLSHLIWIVACAALYLAVMVAQYRSIDVGLCRSHPHYKPLPQVEAALAGFLAANSSHATVMARLIRRYVSEVHRKECQRPRVIVILTHLAEFATSFRKAVKIVKTFSEEYVILRGEDYAEEGKYGRFDADIRRAMNSVPMKPIIITNMYSIYPWNAALLHHMINAEDSFCAEGFFVLLAVESVPPPEVNYPLAAENVIRASLDTAWAPILPPNVLDPLLARILEMVVYL